LMQPLEQYNYQHMLQKHLKLQHHCSHAMLLTCFLHVNEISGNGQVSEVRFR